jgi:hypothetical protein
LLAERCGAALDQHAITFSRRADRARKKQKEKQKKKQKKKPG